MQQINVENVHPVSGAEPSLITTEPRPPKNWVSGKVKNEEFKGPKISPATQTVSDELELHLRMSVSQLKQKRNLDYTIHRRL